MMKKRTLIKNTWYDWLVGYIPEPIKNSRWSEDKIMSLLKKVTQLKIIATCIKNVHGGRKRPRKLKTQRQSEGNIIENIRNLFRPKKRK